MSDDDCMPKIDKVLIAKIDADEREKCANDNEEEIVLEKSVEPREHNEMFKPSKISKPIKIEVIKEETDEVVEEEEEIPDIRDEIKTEKKKKKKPKKLYPHLEKARAKAKENRAKRKAEKDKLKKETKEQKKEARKEKQREIARNHYWEKKTKEEEIETNSTAVDDNTIRTATKNGMSYDKFSSFMDKYNLEKMTAYEKRKAKREEAEKVVKEENEMTARKKRLSRNMVSRQNIRGMYVDGGEDYSDFFF